MSSIGTVPRSPRNQPNYDPSKRERKQSTRQSQNVVYVLTEFALELMRILEAFNQENFQSDGQLRIGKLVVFIHGVRHIFNSII